MLHGIYAPELNGQQCSGNNSREMTLNSNYCTRGSERHTSLNHLFAAQLPLGVAR